MSDLDHLLRFWRALDDSLERVEPAWWGAVVTDSRFPTIWDMNYARIETARGDLTLTEVEAALRPALERSRATHLHIVLFYPEEHTSLLSELGTRGDRLSWDVAMEYRGVPVPPEAGAPVEEVTEFDDAYWLRHRESLREFDITDDAVADQLVRLEQHVMLPAGKRWFTVREGGRMVSFGSLLLLDGVGYVDHVVTFPAARCRGYASAIVERIVRECSLAGAERLHLLAEPDGKPVSLYERLGFVRIGQLASTLRPLG